MLKRVIVQFFDDAKILFQADFGAKSSSRQILVQNLVPGRFWRKNLVPGRLWRTNLVQADFGTNLVSLLTATVE